MWRIARGDEVLEWWTGAGWSRERTQARIYWVRDAAVTERPADGRIYHYGM